MISTTRHATSRAGWIAFSALGLWGLVHVIGGATVLIADTSDGLETLGPNATSSVPISPGDATEALPRFHSLNILVGGFAVLALTGAWWRIRHRWQLDAAALVAAALDVGLIAFFVIPDVLPASQGLIGPVLVVIALAGVVSVHRHPDANPAIT